MPCHAIERAASYVRVLSAAGFPAVRNTRTASWSLSLSTRVRECPARPPCHTRR